MSTKEGIAIEHSADEAGGEAIYSSDGLAPLVALPRPPMFTSGAVSSNSANLEDAVLETESLLEHSVAVSKYNGKSPSWMTSRQRLECLELELKELETRIQAEKEDEGNDVMDLLSQLNSRVSALSTIVPSTGNEEKQESKITESSLQQNQQEKNWESRLGSLEALLTSSNISDSQSNKSVMERLQHVEELAQLIDEKSLEQAAARAKVIRADLEAAAKARAKLSSGMGGGEEGKQIQELYSQLNELEGMSQHLPALAERLATCATLHTQAAHFSSRMTEVEISVTNANLLLQNLQTTLTQVESSTAQNFETFNQNMNKLDKH